MMRPPRGTWLRIDRPVMLLPDPDSPTTHTVLPRGIANEMPSTAFTVPAPPEKCVRRSSISISGAATLAVDRAGAKTGSVFIGVCSIAKSVAEEVECEDRNDHREAGKKQPGRARDGVDVLRL